MLQPRKPLDLSEATEILNTKRPALDLSDAEVILKKKDSTVTPKKSVSATPIGSSGGKGFPKIKDFRIGVDLGSGVSAKFEIPVTKAPTAKKTYRLPTADDEIEMQRRGITPPPSEMLKQTASNTTNIYDLDANGNAIPKKPNKSFNGLIKQDKTKGLYQKGEEFVKQNTDFSNGFSEKTTFELSGGKLIPTTTIKDFKTSEGIDKEIEENDLNLDHPYLYYSTFNKENQPKDSFIETNFGEAKLTDLGINTADFDGFLNKIKTVNSSSYKADFLDKEANGLFEGKGNDVTNGYNIALAKEIQKQKLLDLYMKDINSRDFAKRKLNQEKVNLGKLAADRQQLNTQYTLFDSKKVGYFYEKEMPILTQKLKERDAENAKIYEQHSREDAGFLYGSKQTLKAGWNGFLDRVNQTSSTILDKIGFDNEADELRLLNEERQIQRPNTRDVGYASGKTTAYNGVNYLVTKDGQIIDKDKKIRVTDLLFKSTYDTIVNQSKLGKEDSVFSFQGSAIQAGGVLGDMIVQVALQRGVGIASGVAVKSGSILSKIPISKNIGSAMIAQSALGYSQGLEQTYKAAIGAGIDKKTAKVLATDAAQRMAGLYAVTSPISPQTKAMQAIFGSEGKDLIKRAIASYAQMGKKGFLETFKGGVKSLSKKAVLFTEEGGKEVFQENIQQGGENYLVNASVNLDAGVKFLQETISGDEFVNTSILSFASGGLMTIPGIFSSTDKLKTLQQLSQDPIAFENNLKDLVSKGVFTNDKADVLRKDVKVYANQSNKVPKNLNRDIAMDVMYDLQSISDLETKKKGLDKSFHEELDAEIEAKRTSIKSKIKEKSNQTGDEQLQTTTSKTQQETQSKTEVQETEQEVNTNITDLEKQRDAEIEALKAKRQYDEKNITPIRKKYDALILEEKSKDFDLFHTGAEGMSIESVSVEPRVTRQGRSGKYGGFYTYDNIKNIIDFVKGNNTNAVYGIKLNEGVEITDYSGSIERLNALKLQELRDSGVKVIRGKSLVGKTEIIVVDKSAIKNITKINDTKQQSEAEKVKNVSLTDEGNKSETPVNVDDKASEKPLQEELASLNVSQAEGVSNVAESNNSQISNPTDNAVLAEKTIENPKANQIKNEAASPSNITPDGNLPIGANNVGENGITKSETPIAESVPSSVDGGEVKGDVEVSDLDHAKDQIDKGVIQWNSDIGAERVVLGIDWPDIRKGEKDIKAGKVNTVPAKRLIEAFKTAKDKGGYEYIQGRGGVVNKQFVSLEDIQRANNEYDLTDSEQKEVDAQEVELSKEYESYFEGLDLETQNDIYENKEGINGLGEEPTTSGESKNDVPTEKEGDGANSEAKEKINSKDLESFRDKIKDIPESGIVAKYLSGDTIEKVEGEAPRNNQDIDVMVLASAGNHGMETVAKAKEIFGEQYVEKSLEFLDGNSLKAHEKAILYVSLENEMYNRRILDPENLGLQKLQDLVRKKSQQHLRESSLAINAGRLRAIMKDGYTSESVTDKLFSSEELKNKRKIEKAIQADADAINREAEKQENNPIDSDLEKLISSGVEKQINEIYKKLPTNRRVRADKAITALENIQSKLRGKAYDASIGIPIALIDSGITIIKNSIKAGVNIADAIEIGINHIKEKYGKDWNKEDDFRSDMLDGFKDEGIEIKEPTVKEKTKQQEYKELVKQSLIEAGFGREITVRTKDGKEQRQTLDWKKLAGEEGSINKIKENVEKSLKDKGYTDTQISDIQNDLEIEYNSLRASIIEKSLNELNNRNTPRKPVNIKTSAKKLAELYNYGLFEKEADTYDHLMNSALGMNQLGQDNFMEAKRLAAKLSELFTQKDKDGNNISQSSLKHGERVINKQIEDLLSKVAWSDSNGGYKAMIITKELVSLCQRNALVSVAQALENTTSGYISRFYNKIGFSLDKVDTSSLAKVRRTLSQMTYKDITLNGGSEFGDVTSPFISKSKAQDFIVNASDTKFYHGLASFALGKAYLESADSMHKSALTEKFFQYNLIKVLGAKGYSKSEAINYVSEQLTGQTFDDALITAKQIIDTINRDSNKKVIPNTKESIFRFAHNIVREALIQGKKMTIEEVEASLKAAETAAGFELGHEANNVTSQGLKLLGSHIQIKIDRSIKEKDWSTATAQTGASIIVSNILNPFVGGGTNWALIALQKSGVPTLSTFYWNIKARGSKIDLTSEQGIKNLEKTLKYQLLAKNANTRLVVGATISMAAFMLMKSTGSDDELYEWLKKHPWMNRYLKKIAPPVIQLMLAQKDKKVGDAIAQQMNIKADAFDEGKKVKRIFTDISSGKVDKALGGVGQLAGSRLSMPIVPWRVARDVKNIYRGLAGLPEIKFDYKTSGLFNGFYQGGMIEQMGLRPKPTIDENSFEDKFLKEQAKRKSQFELPEAEKDKIRVDDKLSRAESKINLLKGLKLAQERKLPYYLSKDVSYTQEEVAAMDLTGTDESITEVMKAIEKAKKEYGIEDEE